MTIEFVRMINNGIISHVGRKLDEMKAKPFKTNGCYKLCNRLTSASHNSKYNHYAGER